MAKTASGATIAELRASMRRREDAYVAFAGPRQTGAHDNILVDGVNIRVDFKPVIADIKKALSRYSEEVQRRALYNALNHEGAILYTATKRNLVAQTSIKYSRVSSHLKEIKAHPNKLTYMIVAKDTATRLQDFRGGGKPGGKARYFVWNRSRTFKGAFMITTKSGQTIPVKRIAKGHGAGSLKGLYGPIMPKEMIRPGSMTIDQIKEAMPRRILPRVIHELEYAAIRAGFK